MHVYMCSYSLMMLVHIHTYYIGYWYIHAYVQLAYNSDGDLCNNSSHGI